LSFLAFERQVPHRDGDRPRDMRVGRRALLRSAFDLAVDFAEAGATGPPRLPPTAPACRSTHNQDDLAAGGNRILLTPLHPQAVTLALWSRSRKNRRPGCSGCTCCDATAGVRIRVIPRTGAPGWSLAPGNDSLIQSDHSRRTHPRSGPNQPGPFRSTTWPMTSRRRSPPIDTHLLRVRQRGTRLNQAHLDNQTRVNPSVR